jgi:hypothetical protein
MRTFRRLPAAMLCLATVVGSSPFAADAADKCTAYIGKLPAIITKSGVWCMKKHLATADPTSTAIDIQTDNVTIDCGGFMLDGRGAGAATNATAIGSEGGTRSNLTVRNCLIRGFRSGIVVNTSDPGTGVLVEDNRFDQIVSNSIYVLAHGSVVRRNVVTNTLGRAQFGRSTAIVVVGDAIDNVVDGMASPADAVNFSQEGIYAGGVGNINGVGVLVQGNRVRNLVPKGNGTARGILTAATGSSIRGNTVVQPSMTSGQGLFCSTGGTARDNDVINYTTPNTSCIDFGDSNLGF